MTVQTDIVGVGMDAYIALPGLAWRARIEKVSLTRITHHRHDMHTYTKRITMKTVMIA